MLVVSRQPNACIGTPPVAMLDLESTLAESPVRESIVGSTFGALPNMLAGTALSLPRRRAHIIVLSEDDDFRATVEQVLTTLDWPIQPVGVSTPFTAPELARAVRNAAQGA